MSRRLAIAAAAAATLLLGVAPALAAINPDAMPSNRSAPHRPPWWAAFQDPALDKLLARTSGGAAAEAAAVRAYVELRVMQARLVLAGKLQEAAAQQHALLQQQEGNSWQGTAQEDQRRQWLTTSTARNEHWQALQQTLTSQHDAAVATLAALTHGSPADLRDALAASGEPLQLPQVHAPLPERVAVANDAAAAQLQALNDSAAQALQMRQLVDADELVLRASQLRSEAGAGSAVDVMEAYQRLLADNDRLADLAGSVAVAWARLLQSTGGRAAEAVDAASLAP